MYNFKRNKQSIEVVSTTIIYYFTEWWNCHIGLYFDLIWYLIPIKITKLKFTTDTDEDAFTIQHSATGKCLDMGVSSGPSLASCDPNSRSQLWKWGSGHRLYHVDTTMCLALNVTSKTLSLMDCGSNILLLWRCLDGVVYTAYEMTLAVTDQDQVTTKHASSEDSWLRGGSQQNICHKPYRGRSSFLLLLLFDLIRELWTLNQQHFLWWGCSEYWNLTDGVFCWPTSRGGKNILLDM